MKSYSKIRQIQESNKKLEQRFIQESINKNPQSTKDGWID